MMQPQMGYQGGAMAKPGQMMPGMMPQQQQDGSCQIAGCVFPAIHTCKYDNFCCRDKKFGGCGKRYCNNHRYDRTVIHKSKKST